MLCRTWGRRRVFERNSVLASCAVMRLLRNDGGSRQKLSAGVPWFAVSQSSMARKLKRENLVRTKCTERVNMEAAIFVGSKCCNNSRTHQINEVVEDPNRDLTSYIPRGSERRHDTSVQADSTVFVTRCSADRAMLVLFLLIISILDSGGGNGRSMRNLSFAL